MIKDVYTYTTILTENIMDGFTLSSERSPWFQNVWLPPRLGHSHLDEPGNPEIWIPKLPILQTKDTFYLHTSPKNPCLEGM